MASFAVVMTAKFLSDEICPSTIRTPSSILESGMILRPFIIFVFKLHIGLTNQTLPSAEPIRTSSSSFDTSQIEGGTSSFISRSGRKEYLPSYLSATVYQAFFLLTHRKMYQQIFY